MKPALCSTFRFCSNTPEADSDGSTLMRVDDVPPAITTDTSCHSESVSITVVLPAVE